MEVRYFIYLAKVVVCSSINSNNSSVNSRTKKQIGRLKFVANSSSLSQSVSEPNGGGGGEDGRRRNFVALSCSLFIVVMVEQCNSACVCVWRYELLNVPNVHFNR